MVTTQGTGVFLPGAAEAVPQGVDWIEAGTPLIKSEGLDAVRALRREGVGAWATMDAGPHVKVLCAVGDAESVAARLRTTPGVLESRIARPGAGIERP